jgi:peptidoglycan-N-acetylglucosamine deacetylase
MILKGNGIRATFFLLGRNIPGREHIVQSIIGDGHIISSHGYNHLHAWKTSPLKVISDIRKGLKSLTAMYAIGEEIRRFGFRPPCGKMNMLSLLYLWLHKIPIIFWTVDCLDTWPERHRIIDYAAQKIGKEGGGIVLYHDFDRATDHLDGYVLASLNAVIQAGKKLGLQFLTVDKLCDKGQ